MDRKRLGGRFVGEERVEGEAGEPSLKQGLAKAPRPKCCRSYARKRMAEALPDIAERFVEEAKKGSIPHAKLLMKLGNLDGKEPPKTPQRRGKSVVGKLLDQLR